MDVDISGKVIILPRRLEPKVVPDIRAWQGLDDAARDGDRAEVKRLLAQNVPTEFEDRVSQLRLRFRIEFESKFCLAECFLVS